MRDDWIPNIDGNMNKHLFKEMIFKPSHIGKGNSRTQVPWRGKWKNGRVEAWSPKYLNNYSTISHASVNGGKKNHKAPRLRDTDRLLKQKQLVFSKDKPFNCLSNTQWSVLKIYIY